MRAAWIGWVWLAGCQDAETTPSTSETGTETDTDVDPVEGFASTVSVRQGAGASGVVQEVVTGLWESLDAPAPVPPLDTCEVVDAAAVVPFGFSGAPSALSAGELTVALDGVPVPLDEDGTAQIATWPEGQSLSFAATGDAFPGFDAPDLLIVPLSLAPFDDSPAPLGAVQLTWSGVTSSPTQISLIAEGTRGVSLVCNLLDDGSHVIDPDQLYAVGGGPEWTVTRTVVATTTADGVAVTGVAAVSAVTR